MKLHGTDTVGLIAILAWVGLTVASQVVMKEGMLNVEGGSGRLSMILRLLWRGVTNPRVLIGLGAGVAATVVWLVALSHARLSFAYPFTGLAIVLVLVLSALILRERVPWNRWVGVAIVAAGLWLASMR